MNVLERLEDGSVKSNNRLVYVSDLIVCINRKTEKM